jgi:two-component system sensor histidine kinase YesM
MSIRTKIFISFSLLIVVSCSLISFLWYSKFSKSLTANTERFMIQNINEANKSFELMLREDDYISSIISLNQPNVIDVLSKDNRSLSDYEQLVKARELNNFISSLISYKYYISNILVEGVDGSHYSVGTTDPPSSVDKQPWYAEMVNKRGDKMFIGTHKSSSYDVGDVTKRKYVISIIRAIMKDKAYLGFVNVDIGFDVVENVFSSLASDESPLIIVDTNNRIVFDKNPELIGRHIDETTYKNLADKLPTDQGTIREKVDGKDMLIVYSKSAYTKWTTIGMIPRSNISRDANRTANEVLVIPMLMIFVALIAATLLSHRITRNILLLRNAMKSVQRGNIEPQVYVRSRDEIGELSNVFNSMVGQIKHLFEDVKEREKHKRIFEFKALQAQINPHFLFNTLNSIKWMAELQRADNIQHMVTALLKLLHLSMGKGEEFITIREELEYVENYLTIQKIRYLNKFTVRMDIEQEILDSRTIKFLLQPIVENALIHGLEQLDGKGLITIKGYRSGSAVKFEIIDNGVGIPEHKLDQLLNQSDLPRIEGFNGIGITNVNDRIKLHFGESYGVHLESVPGLFTKVEILLPTTNEED